MARSSMSCLNAVVAALSIAPIVGCGSTPPPPPKGPGSTQTASGAAPGSGVPRGDIATPTSGSILIEDRILKACGDIPDAHFAFDSAAITEQSQPALVALARCFVGGPLKGHGMKLVGHADPRGSDSYNVGLGQKRSGSVATFLSTKALEASRIATSSVGAEEATGTDEAGWAKDRRVDVLLAD